MAAGITDTDHMLSVREVPWHGLGIILPDHPTRQEAQQLVHPWEPIDEPVYRRVPIINADGPAETFEEVEGRHLRVRSDTNAVLGDVADTLGLVTNDQMWDVAEAVGQIGTDIKIETAGSLDGGAKVWILMRLVEPIKIKADPHGDTVSFLAFQNAHNGSASFRAQAVNTRIVCANTSAAADVEAKKHGYEFTFRHTSKVADRIEEAKAAVAMWREGVTVWQNAMDHLATVRITAEQREQFVQAFQPMPNVKDQLISARVRTNVETARQQLRNVLRSETCEGIDLTAFGLYQASLEWMQHERSTRGQSERGRHESMFKRAVLSDGDLRRRSLDLVRSVAGV